MKIIDIGLGCSPVPKKQAGQETADAFLSSQICGCLMSASPTFTFIWPVLTGRLRVTSRWVRNQDLDTSSPAGMPRLHPPFHTPQEQQQRRGLVPPGFGDEVRKLHALWWMSYPCLSLPSGDDAGKAWSHLFLNEMVGHAFRQECN